MGSEQGARPTRKSQGSTEAHDQRKQDVGDPHAGRVDPPQAPSKKAEDDQAAAPRAGRHAPVTVERAAATADQEHQQIPTSVGQIVLVGRQCVSRYDERQADRQSPGQREQEEQQTVKPIAAPEPSPPAHSGEPAQPACPARAALRPVPPAAPSP